MTLRPMTAAIFLAFIAGLVYAGKLPPSVLGLYLATSLLSFIAYAYDKSSARNKQRRIPERTLHLLALIGGWPGALIAQHRLRHKTKKTSFLAVFWGAVILNCGILGWWLR